MWLAASDFEFQSCETWSSPAGEITSSFVSCFHQQKTCSQSSKDPYNTLVESSLGPFCPAVMVITYSKCVDSLCYTGSSSIALALPVAAGWHDKGCGREKVWHTPHTCYSKRRIRGRRRERKGGGRDPHRKTHMPSTDLNPTSQIQICMFMNLWLVIFPVLLSCIARFGSFIPSFPSHFISNCSLVNFLMFEGEVWITSTGLIPHISQVDPQHSGRKFPPTKTKKRPSWAETWSFEVQLHLPPQLRIHATSPLCQALESRLLIGLDPYLERRRKIRLEPGHQNCHSKPPKMADLSDINGETSSNMSIWKDKQLQNIADLTWFDQHKCGFNLKSNL